MTYSLKTQADFKTLLASIENEDLRAKVEDSAWGNAFSVETHAEYANDAERWNIATISAEMILDDLGAYFPEHVAKEG